MGQMIKKYLPKSIHIIDEINSEQQKISNIFCDAAIDFSNPIATNKYAPIFISNKIPYICGTTGLTKNTIDLPKKLTQYHQTHFTLLPSFDPEFYKICDFIKTINCKKIIIEEFHNKTKKDIPSGCAAYIKKIYSYIPVTIISNRQDIKFFRHIITLILDNKRISINYEVFDRKIYIAGILKALEKISFNGFVERL